MASPAVTTWSLLTALLSVFETLKNAHLQVWRLEIGRRRSEDRLRREPVLIEAEEAQRVGARQTAEEGWRHGRGRRSYLTIMKPLVGRKLWNETRSSIRSRSRTTLPLLPRILVE